MGRRPSGPGMLIGDDEIRQHWPEEAAEIIAKLDADPATQAYQPIFNGKRFRPTVIKALAPMGKVLPED